MIHKQDAYSGSIGQMAAVVCVLSMAGQTSAQTAGGNSVVIGPQRRVDTLNPNSAVEPSIAIAPPVASENMEAMTGAIDWRLGGTFPRVGFAITFDGGGSWEQGLVDLPGISLADETGVDATFWGDPAHGDVWMSAIGQDRNQIGGRVFTIKRQEGVHAAQLPTATFRTALWTSAGDEHLPRIAIGPRPGAPTGRNLYVLFLRIGDCFQSNPLPANTRNCFYNGHLMMLRSELPTTGSIPPWSEHSVKPSPYPHSAPSTPCEQMLFEPCEYDGNPTGLIVVDRGPNIGTVIAVAQGTHPDFFGNRTPEYYAVWSTDAAQTWPAYEDRIVFFPPELHAAQNNFNNDWPGEYRLPLHTAAALDPTTGDFYIVACGRREPAGQPGDANLDLYLIRGRTNSSITPLTFDAPVRLELDPPGNTSPDGPDQFLPAITIDDLGGINLVYYDTRGEHLPDSTSYARINAKYARITGLGTPNQAVFGARLTPNTFCTECEFCGLAPCPYEQGDSLQEFVGDYNWIDSHGCDVYVTYMSTHEGKRHQYMHRIDLCAADADDNLQIDGSDPGEFQLLFATGDTKADLNQDGLLDADDYLLFTNAFASAPK